jgi:hypothetical protein
MPVVAVRDVAETHLRAAFNPAASRRYILDDGLLVKKSFFG